MKKNIFAQWWFTLIVVPVVLFIFGFLKNGADEVIFGWLAVFVIAIVYQYIYNLKFKVPSHSLHYLFILFCLNFMMFIGYLLTRFSGIYEGLDKHMPSVVAQLLNSIIIGLISYIIKWLIWVGLSYRYKNNAKVKSQKQVLQQEVVSLREQNKVLQAENNKLKNQKS